MMTRNREIAYERILARSIGGPTILLAIWIARYWPVNDFRLVLKAWLGLFGEFGGVLCTDHVRFDPFHPYIERLPTL